MITPNDCLKPTPIDVAHANSLELMIDKALLEADGRSVNVRIPRDVTMRAVSLVIERYRAVGWLVERCSSSDQREPDPWLSFRRPSGSAAKEDR